ncbi:hypothetical protein DVT68_10605 [Dyella solisilvae]|uniref:Uncharacterized protein n=1 Tax=Dyella solisilvae TaxID=1920168 RepID=A0A370K917_9GAMM|nr:hypothetical protein [Dyella solisilvae]RDI98937.1 hypothetical protein DVT68_10605 [Dyella solisilvae]
MHHATGSSETIALATMAVHNPPPDDAVEAAVLLRRWTRLGQSEKPSVRFAYKGIGNVDSVGYLDWLVRTLGPAGYQAFKVRQPNEAAVFRLQVRELCRRRAEFLATMTGASPAPQMGRALADHARALAKRVLGDDDILD